jgi:hypothetical protein
MNFSLKQEQIFILLMSIVARNARFQIYFEKRYYNQLIV